MARPPSFLLLSPRCLFVVVYRDLVMVDGLELQLKLLCRPRHQQSALLLDANEFLFALGTYQTWQELQ